MEAEKKEALKAPGAEEGMTYDEVVDDSFPASDPPPHSRDGDSRQWADVRAGQLRNFFDNYAIALSTSNHLMVANAYAETFIAAGPKVRAATFNDGLFAATLAQAALFYQKIGLHTFQIKQYEETQIDLDCLLVKIEWQGLGIHDEERVTFDHSYIVQTVDNVSKIVLIFSHNEPARLREQGLIEAPQ
jgi:hypothetical protein